MDTFEIIWLVLLIGAIAYFFFLEKDEWWVGALIIIFLSTYFTITDWACWINESARSVEDCTEWYAKEAYEAAKDRDADEFRDIMHNWNEWIDELNDSETSVMKKTLLKWRTENRYKANVCSKFEDEINIGFFY